MRRMIGLRHGTCQMRRLCGFGPAAAMLLWASCGSAEVLRWNSDGITRGDVALVSAVQRYDRAGRLMGASAEAVEGPSAFGAGASEQPTSTFGSNLGPANVLPAIRRVASRYQGHPILADLDLSPRNWAALFQAMIKVESNYTQGAVSHAGALGFAQLMPGTAKYLRVDPYDPIENLDGGARYLLEQMGAFRSIELALAAYNAGPEAVRKYRGVPPYTETRSHIVKVMAAYDRILAEL